MVKLENKSQKYDSASRLFFALNVVRLIPLYITEPEVGVSKIPRICNNVLFQRQMHLHTTISPFSIDKLIACKTGNVRSPFLYSLNTFIACKDYYHSQYS